MIDSENRWKRLSWPTAARTPLAMGGRAVDDGLSLVAHTDDWTDLDDEARYPRARATTSDRRSPEYQLWVAVDGFWFTEWNNDEAPPLFTEHSTPEARAHLPFMHLDGPDPILTALLAAGFIDVSATTRPDLDVGAGVHSLITAANP